MGRLNREVDDWENAEYVAGMVLAHSSCHRSYHLKKRHAESGKNVKLGDLSKMEKNIQNKVKMQRKLAASSSKNG